MHIGPSALEKMPTFAALIGVVVGAWSEVDLQMTIVLMVLMQAKTPAAIAVYLELRRSSHRTKAIETAAEACLPLPAIELLQDFLCFYRSVEAERNALVHNLTGFTTAMPDAMLWIDIKDQADFYADIFRQHGYVHHAKWTSEEQADEWSSQISYYRQKDVLSIIRDERLLAATTASLWRYFALVLEDENAKERETLFQRIREQPPIAEAARNRLARAAAKNA